MKIKPITDSQFLAAKRTLGHDEPRPRGKSVPRQDLVADGFTVQWTCTCGYRNEHTDTGRGVYFCSGCGLDTQLKP